MFNLSKKTVVDYKNNSNYNRNSKFVMVNGNTDDGNDDDDDDDETIEVSSPPHS
jgi:hypothetical protein